MGGKWRPKGERWYDQPDKKGVGFGPERYAVKSCGKRHGYCKVCRPDLTYKKIKEYRQQKKAEYDPDKLAPGYVPHPTKTMWERHREMHKMPTQHDMQHNPTWPEGYEPPRLIGIDKLKTFTSRSNTARPKDLRPLSDILKEVQETGRSFKAKELRWHFGFSTNMVHRYLNEDARQRRMLQKPEAERKLIEEKQAARKNREYIVIEKATDGFSTYKDIGDLIGVTRERVRQIIVQIEQREGIKIPRNYPRGDEYKEKRTPTIMVAIHCRYCHKILEVPEGKKLKWRKGFCKEHAVSERIWGFIQQGHDWYNADQNERERIRYKADPNRRDTARFQSSKWRNNLKKDPVKWAAFRVKEDAYQKKWHQKKYAEKKAKEEAERKANVRPFIEVPDNGD